MLTRIASLIVLVAVAGACGAPAHAPRPQTAAEADMDRDHPLLGQIWDVKAGRAIDRAALVGRLVAARIVLLGETHDNPRHHAWQAELLRALIAQGRQPAVAFEMLESDEQDTVDAAVRAHPTEPDSLAQAVDWAGSGWPDFDQYRPIFAAAFEVGLPILAANLPMADVHRLAREGLSAMDTDRATALGIDRPLAPEVDAALRAEMGESHCGMLPPEALGGLVLAQRARDAQMAAVIAGAAVIDGAVGIMGDGHARTDRGVPARLREIAPGLTVASVAFVEVDPTATTPAAYAATFGARALPFDYVVFTARQPREDPCEGMRRSRRR